ncbi:hypothetical protein [Dysgonomonas sp.]|jgi:hypothetical protein
MRDRDIIINSVKGNNPHDKLINTIRAAIIEKEKLTKTEKEKVAAVLGDILCLGKESVYRRLRGEVRFSFEEVALISQELGFSVDNIIGSQADKKAIVELNLVESSQMNIFFTKRFEEYISFISKFAQMEGSTVKCALSGFPVVLSQDYEELVRFRFFKWSYQMNGHSIPFNEFVVGEELLNAHHSFANEFRKIKNIQMIINHDIYSAIIRDINYFYDLNLLDNEDLNLIRSELNEMLTEIENISIVGSYSTTDSKIALYLSNVEIDATYFLLETRNFQQAYLSLYDLNGIHTLDPSICKNHSLWIESLKRYSTLITFGGEIQRHKFFKEQRKLINSIVP